MKPDLSSQPILLVEDNPVDLDLTLRAFAKRKLTNPLHVARDGAEALSWIPHWESGEPWPALILLDLKLPKVDGLEVLRQLKAHPTLRAIPVVVLTTSSEDVDMQKAYLLGANSYIVKPVDFDKFIEVAAQVELYWRVLNKSFRSSADGEKSP
ncbi:MAG: response regulator [Burkholderiales bacterium]|nr:response regulator [Burkholderiales bacterium]